MIRRKEYGSHFILMQIDLAAAFLTLMIAPAYSQPVGSFATGESYCTWGEQQRFNHSQTDPTAQGVQPPRADEK